MKKLTTIISYIASHSTELKNKYTNESKTPVEFVCIFCQNKEEYKDFTNSIKPLGKIVENTKSGFTYLLDKPISTVSGPLKLVKIRKPDPQRPERGDADFNTNYREFKKKYKNNSRFEFIKRETFEMLRLSDPAFDVMACFSNLPKSKDLGIKL
jgi:hypothetical protein